jgi:hypothetical protein
LFGHVIPLHLRRLRLSGLGGFAACSRKNVTARDIKDIDRPVIFQRYTTIQIVPTR